MGSHRRSKFRLNREEGKVMGVCAGLADHFDVDVTLVRIGMAFAIFMTFPVALFAYFILGMVAQSGGHSSRRRRHDREPAPWVGKDRAEATRERMRDLDARMAAIETCVTTSNVSLAKEIDALR